MAASLARSILITGASRGIGLELVRQLAQSSPPPEVLLAACRNPTDASALQDLAQGNDIVKILKLDVEDDNSIDAAVNETKALVGELGLNLLINNAGIYLNKPDGGRVRMQTRERLQQTFNVNSTSPIIVTQKFLPLLEMAATHNKDSLSCHRAASIIISSTMGSQTLTYQAKSANPASLDYKSSKTAVNMAAILMAQDLKQNGILVMALHPGWVQTNMGGSDASLTEEQSVQEMIKTMASAGETETGLLLNYKGDILPF